MTNIVLTPVSGSSLIAADGTNESKDILAVQYHGNGKTFEFRGLSPEMVDAYEAAPSKGKYLKGTIERLVRGVEV